MPILVNQGEGKNFEPAPEGLHQAVCVDVVDRGVMDTDWGPQRKVDVIWQVVPYDDDGKEQRDEEGKRYQAMQRYKASLHEKAKLHQHLRAWRGKPFTKDELAEFDVEKLIGANCQLQIVHSPGSNGRVYGNVQAIVPAAKGMTKLRPEDYVRIKDRVKQQEPPPNGADDGDSDLPF